MRAALAHRDFALLWLAGLVSVLGARKGPAPPCPDAAAPLARPRLGKLAKELQRVGITRDQLLAEISSTYRKASHPPTPEEAFDLARAFVDWLPGYEDRAGEEASS
jgi:hypothetical protein